MGGEVRSVMMHAYIKRGLTNVRHRMWRIAGSSRDCSVRLPTRLVTSLLCFILLAGCTADEQGSTPEVTSPATLPPDPMPSAAETLAEEENCIGLGPAPRRGQITLVENGELKALSPSGESVDCLAEVGRLAGNVKPPTWNALADRVLLGNRALSQDQSLTSRLTERPSEVAQWSRPSGTSIVYLDRRGRLIKRSSHGGDSTDISFLARHDAVTYHPAGEHIATSGLAEDGSYGLYLATNIGTEAELLARGEDARFITNLRFAEDGRSLYFTARHGPREWHLHRLQMGAGPRLETLAKGPSDFEYVLSPFQDDLVAWFLPGDCAAGEAGEFVVLGRDLTIPARFETRDLHPVGWLPAGSLVVRASTTGCSTAQPGDVYVLSRREPMLIHEENYGSVSVRVPMPPPPRPPDEEQEVVA